MPSNNSKSSTKSSSAVSLPAVVSMENAGIEGVSGPGGGLNKNYWVKKGWFGQGKGYDPIPPPNYELDDAFRSLQEQGFTAGLCKAVLEQNGTQFAKRFWIIDNSASMEIKDGHRIVTTAERKTVAQQVTRWDELTATVMFHVQMVAVLKSPTHFRMINSIPNPAAHHRKQHQRQARTMIHWSQIDGAKQPTKTKNSGILSSDQKDPATEESRNAPKGQEKQQSERADVEEKLDTDPDVVLSSDKHKIVAPDPSVALPQSLESETTNGAEHSSTSSSSVEVNNIAVLTSTRIDEASKPTERMESTSTSIGQEHDVNGSSASDSSSDRTAVEATTINKTNEQKDAQLKAKKEAFLKLLNQPLATEQKPTNNKNTFPPKSKDLEMPDAFDVLTTTTPSSANGSGTTTTATNKGVVDEQLRRARMILQRAKPIGTTPLTKHVRSVTKEIQAMVPELRKTRKRVIVVIATDGLPTLDDGTMGEDVTDEFVQALRAMEGLPVWLVIRLCTDDPKLREFYNRLDAHVHLPLEVLDDYFGESAEIQRHNPWINYTLPMHRCRELGFHNRILDFLDERPLDIEELREFMSILFGDDVEDIPVPSLQWREFFAYVKAKMSLEQEQYDTQRKRCLPILDLGLLQRTYHGLWAKQRQALQRRRSSRSNKLTAAAEATVSQQDQYANDDDDTVAHED